MVGERSLYLILMPTEVECKRFVCDMPHLEHLRLFGAASGPRTPPRFTTPNLRSILVEWQTDQVLIDALACPLLSYLVIDVRQRVFIWPATDRSASATWPAPVSSLLNKLLETDAFPRLQQLELYNTQSFILPQRLRPIAHRFCYLSVGLPETTSPLEARDVLALCTSASTVSLYVADFPASQPGAIYAAAPATPVTLYRLFELSNEFAYESMFDFLHCPNLRSLRLQSNNPITAQISMDVLRSRCPRLQNLSLVEIIPTTSNPQQSSLLNLFCFDVFFNANSNFFNYLDANPQLQSLVLSGSRHQLNQFPGGHRAFFWKLSGTSQPKLSNMEFHYDIEVTKSELLLRILMAPHISELLVEGWHKNDARCARLARMCDQNSDMRVVVCDLDHETHRAASCAGSQWALTDSCAWPVMKRLLSP